MEAERVADSSQVAKACAELWAKAYDYERLVQQRVALTTREWMPSAIKKNDRTLRAEIAAQDELTNAN